MRTAADIADEIDEAARLWAIRVGDPGFAEWAGFTTWLEADPAHAAAYDTALADEAWGTALVAALPAAADVSPPSRRWPMQAIAACAALLALIGGAGLWYAGQPTVYTTAAGEHREIALADGTRIALNGATRLSVAARDPRQVTLADGEAVFEVHHDAAHPFAVTVGTARLVDLGTVFDVATAAGRIDVAVASGSVGYRGQGRSLRLVGGEALALAGPDAAPVVHAVDASAVGTWRTGTLSYTDAPFAQVAADLTRTLGVRVTVAAGLGGRRFTGTLALAGDPGEAMRRVSAVMGVAIDRQGDGWQIGGDDGASP